MVKKVTSARGTILDFDLMKIKSNLGNSPKPVEVANRESFIEDKLKRRTRRIKEQIQQKIAQKAVAITANKDSEPVEQATKQKIVPVTPPETNAEVSTSTDAKKTTAPKKRINKK